MQKARKASGISRADTLKADLRGQRSGTQIGLGNPQVDTIPNPPLSSPETSGTVKKSERDYYEIISLLGQGGMGKVFKVRHIQKTSTGKVVIDKEEVMKTMSYDAAAEEITDPEEFRKFKERMYDRFITEVQLVSKLDHPNIVRISDFSETEDGEPYFVMEYLEGSDLHNIRAQAGELTWEQVRSIMLQVCDAFTEAHEYEENGEKKPIIHRDIKPMNIFIVPGKNREQLVKVLDFGLAKIMSRTEDGVTKTGETAGGTPDYMSPEQIFGLEVDHRTDIYALGIVMYELLTGQVPFLYSPDKERSDFETSADYFGYINEYQTTFRNMVWENPPMPPSEFMAGIPPEGERIVLKCLEKNSSKRYQSARELRADLENARALSENGSGIGTDSNGHLASVIINQDVLAAAERERNTILEQINQTPNGGNPYKGTMIVRQRGPIYQQKKKKWNKWIAIGALATAVMAAGGIAGVSYQKQSADAAQAAQSAKVVAQERQPPEEPITEPIQAATPADSGVPDTVADEVVSHEISIRSNVSGVSVYIGNDEMCNTGRSRDCSMQLEESQEQVTLTFRRRGFQDERQIITPDSAKSLTVRLQPLPSNPRTTKSGAPMITSEE